MAVEANANATGDGRAWVTGSLGADQDAPLERGAAPLVCVRRMVDGWEVAMVAGDLATRAAFRRWIGLLPPLHCAWQAQPGAWWVSEHGMWQLTRGKHPFALLVGDARRAITGNAGGAR